LKKLKIERQSIQGWITEKLSMQEAVNELRRKLTLEKPCERKSDDVVFRIARGIDNLMRRRRPKCTESSLGSGDALPPDEVCQRAIFQKVELDLIVPVRPPHGRSGP
jgi:hypothetical protein